MAETPGDIPTTRKPRWYAPTPAKFLFAVLVSIGMVCCAMLGISEVNKAWRAGKRQSEQEEIERAEWGHQQRFAAPGEGPS